MGLGGNVGKRKYKGSSEVRGKRFFSSIQPSRKERTGYDSSLKGKKIKRRSRIFQRTPGKFPRGNEKNFRMKRKKGPEKSGHPAQRKY